MAKPYYKKPKFELYLADSLELLKKFKDNSVDMIFADPPYFLSSGTFTCQNGRMVSVKKGDWDIGIAMDTIELSPKLDTVILVSGDGDYVALVQHLRRAFGCRVEVVAFGRSSALKLKEEADSFLDLDISARKYLMTVNKEPSDMANKEQQTI